MSKDEMDVGEVLNKLAELKRTLPEDQYQEIERQVLPRLTEHLGASKPAAKKSWVKGALGWIGVLLAIAVFLVLAQRFEWLWYAYVIVFVGWTVLRVLIALFTWLADAIKPPRMY